MKLRPIRFKKKLNANVMARSAAQPVAEEDEEPTMKLSNAFIVMVILHLVAVGGIYTFESIKVHRPATVAADGASALEEGEPAAQVMTAGVPAGAQTAARRSGHLPATTVINRPPPPGTAAPATTGTSAATGQNPPAPTTAATGKLQDSGNVHVVAKGENPHGIARRYGVSYDDLMRLNKIEDPRRLQINQKLKIPAKP